MWKTEEATLHLIVENTTFTDASAASNNLPPAWKGQKITAGFPVTEGMTMMDAIVKMLKERNVSQTGAENGYISEIGGLKEFDNGQDSGWMGTLNGWFTNKGFQNYVIKPGDEIRIMYTSTGRGADLGGDWGSSDKRLKALDISDSDYLTMFPAFSPDVHEYVIPLHADLDGTAVRRAHVVPTAMNKQYQVHAYVGDEEILPAIRSSLRTGWTSRSRAATRAGRPRATTRLRRRPIPSTLCGPARC